MQGVLPIRPHLIQTGVSRRPFNPDVQAFSQAPVYRTPHFLERGPSAAHPDGLVDQRPDPRIQTPAGSTHRANAGGSSRGLAVRFDGLFKAQLPPGPRGRPGCGGGKAARHPDPRRAEAGHPGTLPLCRRTADASRIGRSRAPGGPACLPDAANRGAGSHGPGANPGPLEGRRRSPDPGGRGTFRDDLHLSQAQCRDGAHVPPAELHRLSHP